jgi:outer membrane protein, multidrug efflux system
MNRSLLVALSGIGLVLGGCSLAPEYRRPEMPVPTQWPAGAAYDKTSADAPAVGNLKWREFFADERLQKVIETALGNNRDLRLASLNVERARAIYGIQRAELYPAVYAQGAGVRQHLSADLIQPGMPRTQQAYSVNLGIAAWEIDFFGRIRSLSDLALEEYFATDEAQRAARIVLVAEVARVYLTFAADRENLQLAESALETQRAAYTLVKKRYDVGLTTELDLKRAQIPLDTARGDVARFTQLVAQDQNALNLLAGSPVPEDLLPVGLNRVTAFSDMSTGLSSNVLLYRPDIMAAEHHLRGTYASIGAARAALFPRISLTTSIGSASNELSGLFGAGTNTWAFVPQFVTPIFDARVWAAIQVSEADQKIVLTLYERTIQSAFREVADALAVQGTIDKQVAAQQSLVAAAADTYSLSLKRYTKGIDNYLGVLDAQRIHFAAQQGFVALRLAKLANQVRLYAVLGGGAD